MHILEAASDGSSSWVPELKEVPDPRLGFSPALAIVAIWSMS